MRPRVAAAAQAFEPWHLKGHQETRLRDFLQLVEEDQGSLA
jgi:hypothetical protein